MNKPALSLLVEAGFVDVDDPSSGRFDPTAALAPSTRFVVASGTLFLTGHATVTNIAAINVVSGILHALWWPAILLGGNYYDFGDAIAIDAAGGLLVAYEAAGALDGTPRAALRDAAHALDVATALEEAQ